MMAAAEKSVPEKRHNPLARPMERLVALQHAARLLGQADLAEGMCVADRTLRAYLAGERWLPPAVLNGAATALDDRAAEILALAETLRGLAKP
jgi:hypothetical protein